jgi:hypothetical protein
VGQVLRVWVKINQLKVYKEVEKPSSSHVLVFMNLTLSKVDVIY